MSVCWSVCDAFPLVWSVFDAFPLVWSANVSTSGVVDAGMVVVGGGSNRRTKSVLISRLPPSACVGTGDSKPDAKMVRASTKSVTLPRKSFSTMPCCSPNSGISNERAHSLSGASLPVHLHHRACLPPKSMNVFFVELVSVNNTAPASDDRALAKN